MKKNLLYIALVLGLLFLAACGAPATSASPAPTATPIPTHEILECKFEGFSKFQDGEALGIPSIVEGKPDVGIVTRQGTILIFEFFDGTSKELELEFSNLEIGIIIFPIDIPQWDGTITPEKIPVITCGSDVFLQRLEENTTQNS